MSAIVATYVVRVTLRDKRPLSPGQEATPPPTNGELASIVTAALEGSIPGRLHRLSVHVESERTDR